MRVAFVNQTGGKPGGAEESLSLLLKNLPTDIDPIVVVFEDGDFAQRLRSDGFTTQIVSLNARLRNVARENAAAGVIGLPRAINTLRTFLSAQNVDLVHTNTVKAHLVAAPAARLCGLPVVLHVRDMLEGLGRFGLRSVASTCSREQIAISNALSTWYSMPHTTVISNPVDLAQYTDLPSKAEARGKLGIPLDDLPLVGIVGRINRWKGHDRFLRAVASVNRQTPVRCVIVGEARFRDADFAEELRTLAAAVGIADRTHFVPWLDDPRTAYAALDVHCNCSVREPFGRTIVEAAAASVPTVSFDDGGAVDIVQDGVTGLLAPAGDTDAFSERLLRLIKHKEQRIRYGHEAREQSQNFAAPSHAAAVAQVLRRNVRRQLLQREKSTS